MGDFYPNGMKWRDSYTRLNHCKGMYNFLYHKEILHTFYFRGVRLCLLLWF